MKLEEAVSQLVVVVQVVQLVVHATKAVLSPALLIIVAEVVVDIMEGVRVVARELVEEEGHRIWRI